MATLSDSHELCRRAGTPCDEKTLRGWSLSPRRLLFSSCKQPA
jgi:hypothetical protein